MKENNVKNDPMRELTNKHLIAHQEVARKKIITMKEDLDNLEKEVPIYTQILKEGNIAP